MVVSKPFFRGWRIKSARLTREENKRRSKLRDSTCEKSASAERWLFGDVSEEQKRGLALSSDFNRWAS